MAKLKIPGKAEWSGHESDLDVRNAHELFFGRPYPELVQHFGGGRGIGRADELLFMPRAAFQYYVMAFVEYLRTPEAEGDSDAASPFLRLLISREKRDPGSVRQIYDRLSEIVDFVATNQSYYDADPNIYGSFADLAAEIRSQVGHDA